MILSMIPEEDIKECVENEIILTVSSLSEGERISHEAKSIGRIARVHAAVDTGMSRIGFRVDEGAERIKKLSELENLKVEGIFSHYAVSDIKDKTFTALQTERFKKVCAVSGEGSRDVRVSVLKWREGVACELRFAWQPQFHRFWPAGP